MFLKRLIVLPFTLYFRPKKEEMARWPSGLACFFESFILVAALKGSVATGSFFVGQAAGALSVSDSE